MRWLALAYVVFSGLGMLMYPACDWDALEDDEYWRSKR